MVARVAFALEHDDPMGRRQFGGCGDAGDAGTDDDDVEGSVGHG